MTFCVLKEYASFLFILSLVGSLKTVLAETDASTDHIDSLHAVFKRQISRNRRVPDDEVYYHIVSGITLQNEIAWHVKMFDDAFSNRTATVTKSVLNSNGTWNETLKIQLKFLFYFYGHPVSQIGVSGNGYITVLEAGHEQNSSTQYIAPLKGTYQTAPNDTSEVSYAAKTDSVWIRWSNMSLVGLTSKISFQAVIFKNSSMRLHYINVPNLPSNVSVTIGLADVFIYNGTYGGNQLAEFLVHKAAPILPASILNNSLTWIYALANCGQLTTCDLCTHSRLDSNFSCSWCIQRGHCGSATVQSLQSWKQYPCNIPKDGICPANSGSLEDKAATVILSFFLAIFLAMIIAFVVTLCVYAHRMPDSRIGQCFLKTRLDFRERFLGLRLQNVIYRSSGGQVRLEEERDTS